MEIELHPAVSLLHDNLQCPCRPCGDAGRSLNSHLNLLAEVFHARPAEVEEMIQRRLEEKNRPVECEEVLWPATFRLGE
jgi:hypothetical protein